MKEKGVQYTLFTHLLSPKLTQDLLNSWCYEFRVNFFDRIYFLNLQTYNNCITQELSNSLLIGLDIVFI